MTLLSSKKLHYIPLSLLIIFFFNVFLNQTTIDHSFPTKEKKVYLTAHKNHVLPPIPVGGLASSTILIYPATCICIRGQKLTLLAQTEVNIVKEHIRKKEKRKPV